jgi:uncharacterized protein YjbI with pentapeptide repeats
MRAKQEECPMSEQQSQQTATAVQATQKSACPHPEAVGKRWGDPISEERQAELKELADKQREWAAKSEATHGPSILIGVRLTGADVFWLASYALVDMDEDADADMLAAKQQDLLRRVPKPDLEGLLLQGATLEFAHLEGAHLDHAELQDTNLQFAYLQDAALNSTQLQGANLNNAELQGATLQFAELQGAHLDYAQLKDAFLVDAHLQGADLEWAQLQGAALNRAQLQGADLNRAQLQGADLTEARMNIETNLTNITLDIRTCLADVVWNDASLTRVPWQQAPRLGDEVPAWKSRNLNGTTKDAATHQSEFAAAVRANRVLAVTLRAQGLNEDADKYAYRAQVLQRQRLRWGGQQGRAFGSWMLDAVSGYGYRPMRSFITYLVVVLSFAAVYFILGGTSGQPLPWNEAIVVSMTAFHGRGFFAAVFQPGDVQAAVAAVEAFIGLLIEIVFIATFTQRFFAR